MNNRERFKAILNYENYDRLPLVHFGYWRETLEKWCAEGHLTKNEIENVRDGNSNEIALSSKLGFDFNYCTTVTPKKGVGYLMPEFESKLLETTPDGFQKIVNSKGVVELHKEGAGSIPAEVDHLLKDRKSWEEHFLPKLQYSEERIDLIAMEKYKDDSTRENPIGLHVGSLFGEIRNMLGIVGVSYLYADDEDLYDEIINTFGELTYKVTEKVLSTGAKFDFAHYWEDICFKNGPLVKPLVFNEKVGPHYKRINELIKSHGINIISLDCDGLIDSLIPTWINNGVNTMFPIEVGTWNANFIPWRQKYGKELRGVGGMNKTVFAHDYAAIDAEIERLKPQIALGGFIPCPDHRIAPDAKWENVQYYCDRMRTIFA